MNIGDRVRRSGGGVASRGISNYRDFIDTTTLGTVIEMDPPMGPHIAVRQFVHVLFDDMERPALMDIDSLEVVE